MSSSAATLPEAVDLSHHVNTLSKSRHPSPLKDIIKFMAVDGMISLAGGELQTINLVDLCPIAMCFS